MGGSDDGGAWGGRIRPDGRCMPLPRAQPTHGKAGSDPGAGGSGDGDAWEAGSGPSVGESDNCGGPGKTASGRSSGSLPPFVHADPAHLDLV
jgi:hypothetical protein